MISADQAVRMRHNALEEISTSAGCNMSVRMLIIPAFLAASISCSAYEGYHAKIFLINRLLPGMKAPQLAMEILKA